MGFTSSFFSGLTITSGILYLCLLHHQRTRANQATILRISALQLNALADPELAYKLATMEDQNFSGGFREGIKDYKLVQRSGTESFKDGWNRELENGIRWMYHQNWQRARNEAAEGVSNWVADKDKVQKEA